ncbi:MAG: hypothetical protein GY765_11345, partial [bacterium]|nr:hypothetical protein [bacterium]
MKYALKERIGDPRLFVGRHKELDNLLKWIEGIKKEASKSKALLARRKMGKTAIMQRLFNLTFEKNHQVIPFYYEVKDNKMWVVDFCQDFLLTFSYQYLAFKTRKIEYLNPFERSDLKQVAAIAESEGQSHLAASIRSAHHAVTHEKIDMLWDIVRNAPHHIAVRQNERIVQMIDEFQFLNDKIYWDKAKKNLADDLAGGYLSTAESKVAPLLVSGSWVGWLLNMLVTTLPARFKYTFPANMPQEEAVEMIYRYSHFHETPVTEETTYLIAQLTEGNPFYIAAVLNSDIEEKDLTTVEGLLKTLEFETRDNRGDIKHTWMEYIKSAFSRVNDRNAKNIVLYLCKNRERQVTRKELLQKLALDMTDSQLEEKLEKLVKADIIRQGGTNYDYQGIDDNLFDKVFRGVYQKEIEAFEPEEINREFSRELEALKKELQTLRGKLNYQKGYFAEYVILDQLMHRGVKNNELLKSATCNLPDDFSFCKYETAWTYRTAVTYAEGISVDVLARAAEPSNYSIVGEIKNRDTKKFNLEESEAFHHKLKIIEMREKLDPVIGFVFSRKGFTGDAISFLKAEGIAYSDDERWLDV